MYNKLKNLYLSLKESQGKIERLSFLCEESRDKIDRLSFLYEESQERQNKYFFELRQSIATLLKDREKNNPPSFFESASELYAFWLNVNANLDLWNECDLVLACPLTLRGTQELFGDKKLIEIKDSSSLKSFFSESRNKRYKAIGIVAPTILNYLYEDQTLLIHLIQMCLRQVIFLTGKNETPRRKELYSIFHKVGFYEILLYDDYKKMSCSTVGHLVGDSFDILSSVPGLPACETGATHVAYRMAAPKGEDLSWRTMCGFLQCKEEGTSSSSEELGLAIKYPPKLGEKGNEQLIKGVMRWAYHKEGMGHASLVGCYAGPSDTNMYAAMFEPLDDKMASVSIWCNDGKWECLQSTTVLIDKVEGQEKFNFPLWLKITDSSVILGTEDQILLSLKDNKLPRFCTVGVRIFDRHLSISDVMTVFGEE